MRNTIRADSGQMTRPAAPFHQWGSLARHLACAAILATSTVAAIAAPPPGRHIEAHRDALREFMPMLDADPARALAFAKSALDRAAKGSANDQRLGDALEMVSLANMRLERYAD